MIRCVLISFLVLFYSCKESMPSGIIKPQKMQEILWDVLRAEALAHQLVNSDTTRTKSLSDENGRLMKNVFLIHNITEDQYQKSYTYYTQHPDKLKNILDSLNAQQIRKSIVDTTPALRKPLKYEGSR